MAHTLRVQDLAVALARHHGADPQRAALAGLLHDLAKHWPANRLLAAARDLGVISDPAELAEPRLLHGPVAAALLPREFGLDDPAVARAVCLHTTGDEGMALLDKVVWLADYLEPARSFPGVAELRTRVWHDLDGTLRAGLEGTIRYVLDRGWPLHLATVRCRNWLLATARRHP